MTQIEQVSLGYQNEEEVVEAVKEGCARIVIKDMKTKWLRKVEAMFDHLKDGHHDAQFIDKCSIDIQSCFGVIEGLCHFYKVTFDVPEVSFIELKEKALQGDRSYLQRMVLSVTEGS